MSNRTSVDPLRTGAIFNYKPIQIVPKPPTLPSQTQSSQPLQINPIRQAFDEIYRATPVPKGLSLSTLLPQRRKTMSRSPILESSTSLKSTEKLNIENSEVEEIAETNHHEKYRPVDSVWSTTSQHTSAIVSSGSPSGQADTFPGNVNNTKSNISSKSDSFTGRGHHARIDLRAFENRQGNISTEMRHSQAHKNSNYYTEDMHRAPYHPLQQSPKQSHSQAPSSNGNDKIYRAPHSTMLHKHDAPFLPPKDHAKQDSHSYPTSPTFSKRTDFNLDTLNHAASNIMASTNPASNKSINNMITLDYRIAQLRHELNLPLPNRQTHTGAPYADLDKLTRRINDLKTALFPSGHLMHVQSTEVPNYKLSNEMKTDKNDYSSVKPYRSFVASSSRSSNMVPTGTETLSKPNKRPIKSISIPSSSDQNLPSAQFRSGYIEPPKTLHLKSNSKSSFIGSNFSKALASGPSSIGGPEPTQLGVKEKGQEIHSNLTSPGSLSHSNSVLSYQRSPNGLQADKLLKQQPKSSFSSPNSASGRSPKQMKAEEVTTITVNAVEKKKRKAPGDMKVTILCCYYNSTNLLAAIRLLLQ